MTVVAPAGLVYQASTSTLNEFAMAASIQSIESLSRPAFMSISLTLRVSLAKVFLMFLSQSAPRLETAFKVVDFYLIAVFVSFSIGIWIFPDHKVIYIYSISSMNRIFKASCSFHEIVFLYVVALLNGLQETVFVKIIKLSLQFQVPLRK